MVLDPIDLSLHCVVAGMSEEVPEKLAKNFGSISSSGGRVNPLSLVVEVADDPPIAKKEGGTPAAGREILHVLEKPDELAKHHEDVSVPFLGTARAADKTGRHLVPGLLAPFRDDTGNICLGIADGLREVLFDG